jgi:hypothetical protein
LTFLSAWLPLPSLSSPVLHGPTFPIFLRHPQERCLQQRANAKAQGPGESQGSSRLPLAKHSQGQDGGGRHSRVLHLPFLLLCHLHPKSSLRGLYNIYLKK